MLRRFASAGVIPALVIPIILLVIFLTRTLTVPKAFPLTTLWCFASLIWGVWAILAPKSWVPQRLPIWGAILGLLIGMFALFVLNMPHVLFDMDLGTASRAGLVAGMIVLYFFLWILVRAVYRKVGEAAN